MAATPAYKDVSNVLATPVQISVANTARDGTGTIVDCVTAATNQTLVVEHVVVQATGTTTAGLVRLFIYDGSNSRLYYEIPVTAITPSGTTAAFRTTFTPPNELMLPPTYKLQAAPHNAETFNVFTFGGAV